MESGVELKKEIVRFILDAVSNAQNRNLYRGSLVGFASADDPLFSRLPELAAKNHVFPHDILPGARSAVAFFLPFNADIVRSNRVPGMPSREWGESYIKTNALIDEVGAGLVDFLAKKGVEAGRASATGNYDEAALTASWSHRSVAFIAGLGRFGVNRMLITKKGCAGRYGSVVLAAELPADGRREEEMCAYRKNGSCRYCIDNCPAHALSPDGFDRHACNAQLTENGRTYEGVGFCEVCGKCVVGPCAILAE